MERTGARLEGWQELLDCYTLRLYLEYESLTEPPGKTLWHSRVAGASCEAVLSPLSAIHPPWRRSDK